MTSFNFFADSVSMIRNAQNSFLREVSVPFSKLIFNFLCVLKNEGYIHDVAVKSLRTGVKVIVVALKYYKNNIVIRDIRVISKPSRRVYWTVKNFAEFYNGLGLFIMSTSSGVMPSYKARAGGIGGEVLCAVF